MSGRPRSSWIMSASVRHTCGEESGQRGQQLRVLLARHAAELRDGCRVGPSVALQGEASLQSLYGFCAAFWAADMQKNRPTEKLPWILVAFWILGSAPSLLVTLRFLVLASREVWLYFLLSSILYLGSLRINLFFSLV